MREINGKTYIEEAPHDMKELLEIIEVLRSPDGCSWDREQTHESLKKCFMDETEEVMQAIDHQDDENLCEELGDVLLQVVLQSQIAEEEGLFSLDDVIRKAGEKMLRRHPHVFSSEASPEKEEVPGRWEAIKQAEKQGRSAKYERKKKEAEAAAAREVVRLLNAENQ